MSDCLSYTIIFPPPSRILHKLGHVSNTYFKLTASAKCSIFNSKRSSVNSSRNWDAIQFPSGEHEYEYDDDLEFGVINKAKSRWRNDQEGKDDELEMEEPAAANSGIHEDLGIFKSRDNKEKKASQFAKLDSKLERQDEQGAVPVPVVKRRRQMMRRSNMIAKQVISIRSAISFGFVSQLWVNTTTSWVVLVVEVRPNLLSGDSERFLLKDILQVGDVILVEDENVIEDDFKMVGLETLVGYSVVTPSGQSIGKVRGYCFNIKTGRVESLELDSFGISIIPSSLVSTYVVFVEDVVEVLSDTVVIHEAAVSRIHKLTKGLWGRQNEFEQQLDYIETRPTKNSSSLGKSKSRRKKRRKSVDEWELPMDFL